MTAPHSSPKATARDALLAAAGQVIAAAGPYPWSMAGVAEQAGVSRRTLYRHFPSKADLIDAVATARPRLRADPPPRQGELTAGGPTVGTGRRLLLASARELFGAKGFEATSVREIAERAGVTKLMIYRHFGSKAGLFQEATMDPIKEFIAQFVSTWSTGPPGRRPLIDSVRDFYAALCEVLADQRDLLAPLLFAGSARHGTEGLNNNQYLERAFRGWFDFMDRVMRAETTGERFRRFDQELASRLIFGMILSVVLHEEWLLPGNAANRDHLVEEMAALTVYGMLRTTPGTGS